MIIRNLDIVRAVSFKSEADAPLFVNTDTPLSGPFTFQRLQVVGRRESEILKFHSSVNLSESGNRPLLDILRQFS